MDRPTDDRDLWVRWLTDAADEVGVDVGQVPIDALLDLASAVAKDVARPMAPVTAFLAGLAAGSGADGTAATEALAALARRWQEPASVS